MGQIFLAILAGVCSEYLFKVCIVSLSVCYVTILSSKGLHCFYICLLRHHTISLRFPLFHYPFVTSLLCSILRVSLPLFITSLFYYNQGFHCFMICVLGHCSILGFARPFLCIFLFRYQTISSRFPFCIICLLRRCSSLRLFLPLFLTRHYLFIQAISTSLSYLFKISIVLLFAYYVSALFKASIVFSSVCYITILSLQDFHCFINCLLCH